MPNLETSESSSAFMDDGSILTSSSFKNHESVCDYSISVENVLLEDLDSYWDDLNARLTVSRMVSDSVIRGIVNAVEQDAADRNSSNEAELNRLAERLALYEPDAFAPKRSMSLPVQTESTAHIPSNCSGLVKNTVNRQHNLRIAAQRHLQLLKSGIQSIRSSSCKVMNSSSEYPVCWVDQRLKAAGDLKQMDKSIDALGLLLTTLSQQADELACTLKDTLLEQRWQWEFQREVDSTVFQAFIREQREELDMELCKQKSLFDAQSQFWFQKVQDLSILQQELDSISKHILSIEQEHPLSHGAQDYFEEMTSHKRKDQFPHKTYKDNITIDTSHIGINSFTEKN